MWSNRVNALSVIRIVKIEGSIFIHVVHSGGRGGPRSYTTGLGAAEHLIRHCKLQIVNLSASCQTYYRRTSYIRQYHQDNMIFNHFILRASKNFNKKHNRVSLHPSFKQRLGFYKYSSQDCVVVVTSKVTLNFFLQILFIRNS